MTYIIKRRVSDSDLYLACHDTYWGWWPPLLSLAARFASHGAAHHRLCETKQPNARIVRLHTCATMASAVPTSDEEKKHILATRVEVDMLDAARNGIPRPYYFGAERYMSDDAKLRVEKAEKHFTKGTRR